MSLPPQLCRCWGGSILGVNQLTQASLSVQTSGRYDPLLFCLQISGVKGIEIQIVSSYHLSPWPVPSWDVPLLSASLGRVKLSPPAGQKNAGGEKEVTHQGWSCSIATCHGHSQVHRERRKPWFCGVDVNAFEKHSFHHSPGCLCQLWQHWRSQMKLVRNLISDN